MDMRQIKAIERANKERILKVCPGVPESSGIYFLLREENGFKYGYIGQAKHLLTRLAQHLRGYQHIDLSLKKHGLYSDKNPTGYKVHFLVFPENMLNEMEQKYILKYANSGYQMRNKTSGSQGEGKQGIADNKPSKGYYDGVEQGKKKSRQFVADLFKKHLVVTTKKQPPTKLQEKALQKFNDFINFESEENNNA
jgi:hypothetical protein